MERRGPAVEPREIMQETDAIVRVTWGDGVVSTYAAPALRRVCPCAQCVDEWTGERMLKSETVANDLHFNDIEIVGRYALNFKFSDGHETGIYSFRYLREIGEKTNEESKSTN